MEYLVLALSAFAAATIVPFYSEVTLVVLLAQELNIFGLWLAATIGNTLGAVVNFYLGRYLAYFEDKKWFPFSRASMRKAESWFQRYGVWSVLFAWLPIGGDAITLVAGILRVNFPLFLILVSIGKGLRYAVVIAIYYGFF